MGQITDAVTVTAGTAVLQTDRADVRTEIPSTQLENLPVPIGRNYQNLFVTVPGISPPENMHSVAVNPARGLAFSSNGTTRNANSIRIEGAISNNLWLPHVAAYVPALEAIEASLKAGFQVNIEFIFGYPGETPTALEQTTNYAIDLDPDFANFYPAVPYPGTELYAKAKRDGLLASEDWARMEYSYYLLSGNGLNERVVMDAIHRAKRRFFLRPGYLPRPPGDVARPALSKQSIFVPVMSRTLFGAKVIDTSQATLRNAPAALAEADRR